MSNSQATDSEALARIRQADRVTWLAVIVNIILTVGKLVAGIIGGSAAMIADAVHSLSDFATDFAVMIGMRMANRPEDDGHPYGHGKFETLAAVIIGMVLSAVGLGIAWHACVAIWDAFVYDAWPETPGTIALWAGIISILVKEWLFRITLAVARRTQNEALLANAWHHRSDALSSIGTVIGIGGALLLGGRWAILDACAAVLVSLILLRVAWDIVAISLNKLMEHGMTAEEQSKILECVHAVPGVFEPHHLRSRWVGALAVIEFHLRVDGEMTVYESHDIACQVEQLLDDAFGRNAIVTIHIEPRTRRSREVCHV